MRSGRFRHRVDRYAEAVLEGGVLAGPLVRLACARHFRDRERAAGDSRWFQFSEAHADQILDFFEGCLRLPDVVDSEGEPQPFRLDVGTQFWTFVLGSGFGWIDEHGYRRFREWYIEAGKGTAKTPVLAGVGLYGLTMDGERAAEIYAAAADQDQSMIMFRDAVRIAQASPDLAAELEFDGGAHIWQIRHPESLSFFRTFSRESGQKSGPRPHMGLLDELHEHGGPEASVKIRAGAKRRPQPLFAEITNSGYDRTSICWQRHEHARKVVEQAVEDDQLLAYVCALDPDDDPLTNEGCWPKTNPYIGVSVSEEYLRRQVANAKNIPAETNNVLRLNFCTWTQQDIRAIPMTAWQACATFKESDLLAMPCFGGLDLGQSDDFTAWVRIWVLPDGRVAVRPRFWLPQSAIERYPHRPYDHWKAKRLLDVTPGNTTDYTVVQNAVLAECKASGVRTVGYDKRFAEQMAQNLMAAGVEMINMPQGPALNEGCVKLSALIASGQLAHGHHEILTWMASNYVERPSTSGTERRPDKNAAEDKIDGIVALIMALMQWIRQPGTPQYQMMFIGRGHR